MADLGKANNLSSQRFGRWTVGEYVGGGTGGHASWLCVCDCGVTRIVLAHSLRSGRSLSCGCFWRAQNSKHGKYMSRVYRAWTSMLNRCQNARNRNYPLYGGRGIRVCDRWHTFENFFGDMGEPAKGQSLERKDNHGNYEPENCRWTNSREQARNRRSNQMITLAGMTLCIAEWERLGLSWSTISNRLKRNPGWPVGRILYPFRYYIRHKKMVTLGA